MDNNNPPARPEGTVAFLFTDVEGSTERWELHGDSMASAMRLHNSCLNKAISDHGGFIFKTVGDEYCIAFSRVSDAASAAVDAQRAILGTNFAAVDGISVRMAIHVGEALLQDGDYFGPTVNRVARLLGFASGGQILLSQAAKDMLSRRLPEGASVDLLGNRELRGFADSESIYELIAPGLPDNLSKLRGATDSHNSLPRPRTSLIGREPFITKCQGVLDVERLLTLTGSGGVGKTRIALAIASERATRNREAAWFVDLAPISDAMLVASTVASSLGLAESLNRSTIEVVANFLGDDRAIVVLDNCEHVIDEAARVVEFLLDHCPHLRILVTSREALGLDGEHVMRVPSLPVPDANVPLSTQTAMEFGAIQLFMARAKAAGSQFTLSDQTAAAVAEISRRLDGIPLAIELAANATSSLSVTDILAHLDRRFDLLTGGSRSSLPRQRTLRALIEWSHDLLSEPEHMLFRRLSVFAGGWSVESAQTVCSDEHLRLSHVVPLLANLVAKSLVIADTTRSKTRYGFLESVRVFALERLETSGEAPAYEAAHLRFVQRLAEDIFENRGAMSRGEWLPELEPELENVRAALARSAALDGGIGAAQIASALTGFWYTTGRLSEGRRWIDGALPAAGQMDPALTARLFLSSARLAKGSEAYKNAIHANDLYEQIGDKKGRAWCCHIRAWLLRDMGRLTEALGFAEQGLALWRELGGADRSDYVFLMDIHATILRESGEFERAASEYQEVLSAESRLGQQEAAAVTRVNLAELAFARDDAEGALHLALEAANTLRNIASFSQLALALFNAAGYSIAQGRFSEAERLLDEALTLERKVRSGNAPFILEHLATIHAHKGDVAFAARIGGYVDSWYARAGYQRGLTEQKSYEIRQQLLRERLEQKASDALSTEGSAMSEQQAFDAALAVVTASTREC